VYWIHLTQGRDKKPNSVPPLSHLTSCTPTEPDLHFTSSVTTAFSDAHTLTSLTFKVTNLKSTFRCFCTSKPSVQLRGSVQLFVMCCVFTVRICYPSPNPQPGGPHPFSAVRHCSLSTTHIHNRSLRRRHAVVMDNLQCSFYHHVSSIFLSLHLPLLWQSD